MRWGCWVADLVADMLKCVWLLELCMCLGRSYLRSLLPADLNTVKSVTMES